MKTKRGRWIVVLFVILGVFGLWYVSHAPSNDTLIGSDVFDDYEPAPGVDTATSDVPVVTNPQPPHTGPDTVACTMDAKLCPDGSYVGRVGPDCAFAACPDAATPEPVAQYCAPGSSSVDVCIEIYQPVCAQVQVECITTPCNPVPQTFSNSCFACTNDRVISYVAGACAE